MQRTLFSTAVAVAVVAMLFAGADRAWAQSNDAAVPATPAVAGGAVVAQPVQYVTRGVNANSRYRWHNGRWWYWLPSQRWVYWHNGHWHSPGRVTAYRYPTTRYYYYSPGVNYGLRHYHHHHSLLPHLHWGHHHHHHGHGHWGHHHHHHHHHR